MKSESKTGRNIIAMGLVFLFLVVGALGYVAYEVTRPPTKPTPTMPTKQQYDVTIRYTERYADALEWNSSGAYLPPKHEGYTYLIVTLSIQNKIDRKFDTYYSWFNVVANGIEYSPSVMTTCLDDSLEAVELHKGGTISGSIVFEVPKGTGLSYALIYEHAGEDWNIEWIRY